MKLVFNWRLCCCEGDDDGQRVGGSAVTESRSWSHRDGPKHRGHPAARRGQGRVFGHCAAAGAFSGRPGDQGQQKLPACRFGQRQRAHRSGSVSGVPVRLRARFLLPLGVPAAGDGASKRPADSTFAHRPRLICCNICFYLFVCFVKQVSLFYF